MAPAQPNQSDLQDALRSVRQFIGGLSADPSDQSMAHWDGVSNNAPYQYQYVGANGASVEGANISLSAPGASVGFSLSPMLMLAAAAVAAYLILK
jgi:hypothetical protein